MSGKDDRRKIASIIEDCLSKNLDEKEIGKELERLGESGSDECFLIARHEDKFLCLPINGVEAKTLHSIVFSRMHAGRDNGIELGEIDLARLRPGAREAPRRPKGMKQ